MRAMNSKAVRLLFWLLLMAGLMGANEQISPEAVLIEAKTQLVDPPEGSKPLNCADKQPGVYVTESSGCRMFQFCQLDNTPNGKMVLSSSTFLCPEDKMFHIDQMKCQPRSEVDCSDSFRPLHRRSPRRYHPKRPEINRFYEIQPPENCYWCCKADPASRPVTYKPQSLLFHTTTTTEKPFSWIPSALTTAKTTTKPTSSFDNDLHSPDFVIVESNAFRRS